ncbi:MAG: hypothetical protein WCD29_14055 [Pseudolabrys sp.]
MGSFIAILGVILISVECGYRLGKFRLSRREQEKEAPVGTMVGATLGLLAFILAFTFGLASSRFDNRRQLLLDEANALGTTYLRAGMLPGWGEEVRRLLRDYIGHRLDAVRSGDVTEGIRRSENIQQQVWTEAETVAQKNLNSIVVGLFSFRWCYCAEIIMGVAVAFLLVASSPLLAAARGPGRDLLRPARHRADAAGAAGAVVAEAADHERSAFFLFGRAPHPWLRHQKAG